VPATAEKACCCIMQGIRY